MTKVTLTIQRPNGETETVNATETLGLVGMTDAIFARIRRDTRRAGRGDVLSYEIVTEDTRTEAERAMDEVRRLEDEAERLYERDPVSAITARKVATEAREAHEAKYGAPVRTPRPLTAAAQRALRWED